MIYILIEHDLGKMNKTATQGLVLARELAQRTGGALVAVLIGAQGEAVVEPLQKYGLQKIVHITHPQLDDYAPDAWAESLVQLIGATNPDAVLAMGSERGNEVMARVGAKMNIPMAANCTVIQPGESYRVTRVRWGGSLLEEAFVDGSPKLLTIAQHTFEAEEMPAGTPEMETFSPTLTEKDFRVRVVKRIPPEGGISLTDARVVVGGGRGVGSKEGFATLEELAHLLGGAVGGSRVVTNLGWRPHTDQVGQTGARIAPELYIACGISGAVQHWVGCMGSKKILAINTDPEAPIVTKADYAVIGDLHVVIPAVCAELRKMKG
ncbi:MAG: electron transfer flavoprotein subunit alpha/FixB family protein [Anaerolineales bacterium]|nr:electron transfer flavoprotein subunit alpha/FixB family protein [Anaerolineales bacterium]